MTLQSKSKERQLMRVHMLLLHLSFSPPSANLPSPSCQSVFGNPPLSQGSVLFPSRFMVRFSSPHLLALTLLKFLYEFMCSTWMAEVETVRQRSLWAVRSATVTGLYWISPADTVLY